MSEALESQNRIAKWLEKYGFKIWFDKKNPWDYPTFTGSSSKFDILAFKNGIYNAIEIKPGDKNVELLDGFQQIIKYAGEYYAGKSQFLAGETKVNINNFLFATKYSDRGFLYNKEADTKPITGEELSTQWNQGEYLGSFTFCRLLWRIWDQLSEVYGRERIGKSINDLPSRPRVGIIVAKFMWKEQRLSEHPFMYANGNIFRSMVEMW